jgi:hypothetical protein
MGVSGQRHAPVVTDDMVVIILKFKSLPVTIKNLPFVINFIAFSFKLKRGFHRSIKSVFARVDTTSVRDVRRVHE